MDDRSRMGWAIVAGAAIGGFLGFLFLTDRGRRLRSELESQVDDLASGVGKLQDLASQVRDTAQTGWQRVQHLTSQVARDASAPFESGAGHRPN